MLLAGRVSAKDVKRGVAWTGKVVDVGRVWGMKNSGGGSGGTASREREEGEERMHWI